MAKAVKTTRTKTATTGCKTQKASACGTRPMPTEEQIRARAYEIFLSRNGGPGDPQSDWQQAERELTGTSGS